MTVQGATRLADVYVNGHIVSVGEVPEIKAHSNLGENAIAKISGTDTAGNIGLKIGTNPAAAIIGQGRVLATVKYNNIYSAHVKPNVSLMANDYNSANIRMYVEHISDNNNKYTGFRIMSADTLIEVQDMSFSYMSIGVAAEQDS